MKEYRQLISEKKRDSTDVVCLLLFTSLTILLLIAGIYSYIQGSTAKYSVPYDSDGLGCGLEYPGYNYIYFPSPQVDSLWITTCVKACPSEPSSSIDCKTNSAVSACVENNSPDNTKAFHIYETQTFRNSICLPSSPTIKERVVEAIGAHFIEEMFGSVLKDWTLLLLVIPVAALIAIIAIILIRVIAGYVIYLFYTIIIIALIAFGIFLVLPTDRSNNDIFILKQNEPVAIAVSVLCFLLGIFMLFLFISYRDRIRQTVQYIDKSNEFFKNNYSIILLPIILVGIAIAFIFFWLFLTLSFYSQAKPVSDLNQLPYQHYVIPHIVLAMLGVSIFYLIWSMFFLMHIGRAIISATFIRWKFDRPNPYLTSSKTFLTSHIGSACISSLLTSLFGLFKFEVNETECGQGRAQEEGKCTSFFSRCYACFCCCCINFIFNCFHHAGFAYLNLSGLPYCQSSSEVFQLIREERVRWSVVVLLYSVFNELVPIVISIGNMFFANFLVNHIESYHDNTANRILLLAVVALITYTVSEFFMAIYSEAVQTSFILEEFHKRMPNKEKYPLPQAQKQKPVLFQPASPRSSLRK